MQQVLKYYHHGEMVYVQKGLKGRHWEHCLCALCKKHTLDDRENNCPIANALYRFDVLAHIVTPLWECLEFEPDTEECEVVCA